eukprot:1022332-Prorocentrum_minimum.AAC.1
MCASLARASPSSRSRAAARAAASPASASLSRSRAVIWPSRSLICASSACVVAAACGSDDVLSPLRPYVFEGRLPIPPSVDATQPSGYATVGGNKYPPTATSRALNRGSTSDPARLACIEAVGGARAQQHRFKIAQPPPLSPRRRARGFCVSYCVFLSCVET